MPAHKAQCRLCGCRSDSVCPGVQRRYGYSEYGSRSLISAQLRPDLRSLSRGRGRVDPRSLAPEGPSL
eukprot:6184414-Pleurochrysis_carterae.AAC.1